MGAGRTLKSGLYFIIRAAWRQQKFLYFIHFLN